MEHVLNICGAVLSILGTAFIWVDAQKVGKKMTNFLLEEIAPTIGRWQDDPIDDDKINEFRDILKKSSKINIRGFIFLILGFILQLVANIPFCQLYYD